MLGEGYQYRSLNSYKLALSVLHENSHPLVGRMHRVVHNRRSPVAREPEMFSFLECCNSCTNKLLSLHSLIGDGFSINNTC